jgi:hypothetical protein
MNKSLLAVLNDAERLLADQTGRAELAALDEDAAIELEDRIRRARNKYVGQYRRAASAAVAEHGWRGKARPDGARGGAPATGRSGPAVSGAPAGDPTLRSPVMAKRRASTRAAGARQQAKRDSR